MIDCINGGAYNLEENPLRKHQPLLIFPQMHAWPPWMPHFPTHFFLIPPLNPFLSLSSTIHPTNHNPYLSFIPTKPAHCLQHFILSHGILGVEEKLQVRNDASSILHRRLLRYRLWRFLHCLCPRRCHQNRGLLQCCNQVSRRRWLTDRHYSRSQSRWHTAFLLEP